ncbi:MAG: TraR/DksA C4-type zinc finger protein [Desulfatiglans sp.]|jgi:DnaK suppressor protein|nr:TraR/DksA C4-type zinc finger protein [Thermodesulfobacteriota bacterium]MEE4351819.1 TraR/DksA C4-type zinc finger protein [Desulfatiglans sp.]
MLSQGKKEYYKSLLLQMAHELVADKKRVIGEFSMPNEPLADLFDQASKESDTGFSLRLKEREGRLIAKIESAMEKLEIGDYGLCEDCGRNISEERLAARPMATLCIRCKKEQEAREKKRGL